MFPSMLTFFKRELVDYKQTITSGTSISYPTIYPICLILSKLRPFVFRSHSSPKTKTLKEKGKNTSIINFIFKQVFYYIFKVLRDSNLGKYLKKRFKAGFLNLTINDFLYKGFVETLEFNTS